MPAQYHTFIRIGTCGTFQDDVSNGTMAIFDSAARYDGASRLYAPIEFPAVAAVEDAVRASDILLTPGEVAEWLKAAPC